jgi:RimJ/RimL family protein N-acetyltransferase
LAGDREVASTTRLIPHPYDLSMAVQWLESLPAQHERDELRNFAITLKAGGELIGSISLILNQVDRHAELGYWVGRPYWNHGYATEASAVVVAHAFEKLHLHRVYAHYMSRNPASGRVMQKIGMRQEGIMRDHRFKWGKYEDLVVCGLTADDYRAFGRKG